MSDQELRKLLEQLHSEIENADAIEDKDQELLRDLRMDIGKLLERSEGARGRLRPSIASRLEDTIGSLEISYPEITSILSRILDILGGAGV